jgi:hypothetical protein
VAVISRRIPGGGNGKGRHDPKMMREQKGLAEPVIFRERLGGPLFKAPVAVFVSISGNLKLPEMEAVAFQ